MEKELWHPQIDEDLCTGCGDCILICPTSALASVDGLAAVVEPSSCSYCGWCETICPEEAAALPYQILMEPPSV